MVYIPLGCPLWTLGSPQNVNITHALSSSTTTTTVNVTCNEDSTMVHTVEGVHPTVTEYTCDQHAEWTPLNFIPDCIHTDMSVCPDWRFNISWTWIPDSFKSINSDCNITDTLANKVQEVLQLYGVLVHISNVWNVTEKGTIYLHASMNITTDQTSVPDSCPTLTDIKTQLDNLDLSSHCEGSAQLTNANISTPTTDCPAGLALVKNNQQDGRCWPCPRGMSAKTAVCELCPLGTYREDLDTKECSPCPQNMTTTDNGSTSSKDCKAMCTAGSFSSSGVEPCLACPRGMYQPEMGSKMCLPCTEGLGTIHTETTTDSDCIDQCKMNEYSETGFLPCSTCPHGYYSNNTGSTTCLECNENSTSFITCTDDCGEIECGENGHCVSVDTGPICYCQQGYIGDTCDDPISHCDSVDCQNGGTCVNDVNGFQCHCLSGYTGVLCESVTDPCLSYPCVNGHCISHHVNNSFSCVCFEGFQGKMCDIQINNCVDHQCKHGECINLIGHYMCNCTATGYYGDYCEEAIDHCHDNNMCMNNGTCVNNMDSLTCNCANGYEGPICDQWMGACEDVTCQNGGQCVRNTTGNPYCVCMSGYSGAECEIDDQICNDNPCQNDATCVQYPDRVVCQCDEGYTGDLCDTALGQRCEDNPCNLDNSVECVDMETGYQCYCRPGWTGDQCEEQVDLCESDPCLNGGLCQSYGTHYVCDCLLGFAGHQCEHNVDECHSNPCMNGGSCTDLPRGYECECTPHFTGVTCEQEVDGCQSDPCLYGTCLDSIDGYVCLCDPEWTGVDCNETINKCISLPCYNGGNCTQNETQFTCTCLPEYTGEFCESEIKPCDPNPCINGGECMSENLTFTCLCPNGYYGNKCELVLNTCDSLVCQHGGTCVEDGVIGRCDCTSLYTGVRCEKEKSDNFDITVSGDVLAVCETELVQTDEMIEATLCFSYRYAPLYDRGLVLKLLDDRNVTLLAFYVNRLEIFPANESSVIVEFGQVDQSWHQVCLLWSSVEGQWSIYFDQLMIQQGDTQGMENMFSRFKISTLQKSVPWFQGQITGVNVYSKMMSPDGLNPCNHDNGGDIISWVMFDSCISENEGYHVNYPSVCPSDVCLSGYKGTNCDQLIDKEPPVVESCPSDVVRVITADELRTVVTWSEPVFVDNVDVVHINQTYFSGDLFTYGEYQVIYMAFDAEDNHAVCFFHVIVTVRHCRLPSSPINGERSCDTQSSSLPYCSISCLDPGLHQFTEEPAHLYICREGGVWDPPRGKQFTFPPCAGYSTPYQYYQGEILFNSHTCTDAAKLDLTTKVQQQFYQTGLCQNSDCPTSYITVDCDTIITVKRSTEPVQYKVDFSIPSPSNPTMNSSSIFQSFESFVKGNITGYRVVDFTMDIYPQCDLGQVLSADKLTCVNCGKGYYYSSDTRHCELCPLGSYTDTERQLTCTSCGDMKTTLSTGSASIDKCFSICNKGFYLLDGECEPCEIGYYQDTQGSTQCKPCLLGYTTLTNASTDIADCYFPCAIQGYMMSEDGSCVPCPRGSYKSELMDLMCTPCPTSFTTLSEGAGSVDLCIIVICNVGYKRTDDNVCEPCSIGTYQNESGQDFCHRCPAGHTTLDTGAVLLESCVLGEVDECTLQTDNCPLYSMCVDTSVAFLCECNLGYTKTPEGTCRDNCLDVCIHGNCHYDTVGNPVCKCHDGYEGLKCDTKQGGLSAGSIIGISVAVVIFVVLLALFVFICLRYASHHKGTDRQLIRFPIHRTDLRSSFRAIALAMNPFESVSERTVSSVLRGNTRKSKASNTAVSDNNSNISSPSKTSYF